MKFRDEFHKGTYYRRMLGDDIFEGDVFGRANQHRCRICSFNEVIETVCCRYIISEELLKAPGKVRAYIEARALTALFVQESSYLSLTELGKALKREISPPGRTGRRLLEQAHQNARLAELIEDLRSRFLKQQKVKPESQTFLWGQLQKRKGKRYFCPSVSIPAQSTAEACHASRTLHAVMNSLDLKRSRGR